MVLGLGSSSNRRKVLINTDDGKKAVSMVEGAGVFVCHKHDFLTEDKTKFDLHMKEEGHLLIGSVGKCIMCGKRGVSKDGLNPGQSAICDTCTLKLADQAAAVKKRLAEMRKK